MSSEDKIVPITRGDRTPKQGCFAVIAGSTRVDVYRHGTAGTASACNGGSAGVDSKGGRCKAE